MEWIAVLLFVGFVIWLMVRNRTFRFVVLGLIAVLVVGGWAWYEKTQADERRAYALIKPTDIEFRDPLISTGISQKMTATIKNNSSHSVSSIYVTVTAFDCPQGVHDKARCETIGQDTVWFGASIPPGQVRAGDAYVHLSNLPRLRGDFQWNFTVDRVRANLP